MLIVEVLQADGAEEQADAPNHVSAAPSVQASSEVQHLASASAQD